MSRQQAHIANRDSVTSLQPMSVQNQQNQRHAEIQSKLMQKRFCKVLYHKFQKLKLQYYHSKNL